MDKRPRELEQFQLLCTRDRLGTAANPQLAVDIAGVFLDRVYGDHQFVGDLRVGITFADQAHDLQFARGELVKQLSRLGSCRFPKCGLAGTQQGIQVGVGSL